MFKKMAGPSPEDFKKTEDDMNAFLKRDFDALKPEEQQAMLAAEAAKLRGEMEAFGENVDEKHAKFTDIVRARAEVTLNKRLRNVKE